MFKLIIGLLFFSCASRGLKISEQIPEYHPEHYHSRKMIFAHGGDKDKIMYQNITNKNIKRAIDKEEDRISLNDSEINYNINPTQQKSPARSIASIPKVEEDVVYVAPKAMYTKGSTFQIKTKGNESLESLTLKYLGTREKLYEMMLYNPHLFKINAGDIVNIPKKEIE